MRLFIRHNRAGEIVSATKANVLAEDLEHPYGDLAEDDSVLEVDPTAELEVLDSHEIGERYVVDVAGKQLKPKGQSQTPRRRRR